MAGLVQATHTHRFLKVDRSGATATNRALPCLWVAPRVASLRDPPEGRLPSPAMTVQYFDCVISLGLRRRARGQRKDDEVVVHVLHGGVAHPVPPPPPPPQVLPRDP